MEKVKKCGLYGRVSTMRQALLKAGSIEAQIDRLKAYIDYRKISEEVWRIAAVYEERGQSGKDNDRPELKKLMADVEDGKVNTVICTKIDRISRSLHHFGVLMKLFKKHDVEFISLEENFDTATPMGRAMLKITLVFAELEREQTSKRTKDKMLWSAEQGYWTGSQILGYDMNPEEKGVIVPNEVEAATINFLFDTYLEVGSITTTVELANKKGYRTKEYVSRRNVFHEAGEFTYSTVRMMLLNPTYIGMKEINKKKKPKKQNELPENEQYRLVEGKWKAIVDKEKFYKVKELIETNCKHKNNGALSTRHKYTLNGFLNCHLCGERMEGRSGHGHQGRVYYYYYCTNPECKEKVSEPELETTVHFLIKKVCQSPNMLSRLAGKINQKMKKQLPDLMKQKDLISNQLESLSGEAKAIFSKYMKVENGKEFVEKHLAELEDRKNTLRSRCIALDEEINDLRRESVTEENILLALTHFDKIFTEAVKPYKKKKIIAWFLEKIGASNEDVNVGLKAKKFRSDITKIYQDAILRDSIPGSQYKGKSELFFFRVNSR